MENQSTNPKPELQKVETIQINLRPDGHSYNVIHSSKGCQHYFVQKTGTTCECENCNLGLMGNAAEINKRIERLTNQK